MIDAGIHLCRAGLEESRAWLHKSRSRIERLLASEALRRAGKTDEADALLAEVVAEQEREGVR